MSTEIGQLLSDEGPVATRLGADFEFRQEQSTMAEAVAGALARRGRLLVEAGTGVGKSFAYLLPAIDRVANHGERVVIATNTIALQEQLLEKDIPLLRSALPHEFSAVLVKGRGNYLSIRRLELASRRQESLMPDFASRATLHTIEDWAYETADGTLSTLPQLERPAVWDRVQSDSGNCMGRRCPHYDACFYQKARRRMERGDLLICNHALFFSDLALRMNDAGFLPDYDHVILDEAHCIEDVATEHFGASLSEGRTSRLLTLLRHERTGKGFLGQLRAGDGAESLDRVTHLVERARAGARLLFDRLAHFAGGDRGEGTSRAPGAGAIEDTVAAPFTDLALALKRLREEVKDDENRYELTSFAERASAIAMDAEILLDQKLEGCAYWIDVRRYSHANAPGATTRVTLACSPIEVGPILRDALFAQDASVVLTSATLTVGRTNFRHVADRVGCDITDEESQTLALGSPFNLASQIEVYIDPTMPDPRSDGYADALSERVLEQVVATDGGAFVLFTSFATLGKVDDALRTELEGSGIRVLAQGRDGSRGSILERFRANERSVLFGAASFWQGVDVRGAALRNVIITRLPFEPPDRPITEARAEVIRTRGKDPFMDDSLPRAVLRFKQGIGRLIRSSTDRGRVVVLDPRIVTKRYGRIFAATLPEGAEVHQRTSDGWTS